MASDANRKAASMCEWWPADGAIIVRKSAHPEHPYYLQRSLKAPEIGYFSVHALIGEEFATRDEAEARAEALRAR